MKAGHFVRGLGVAAGVGALLLTAACAGNGGAEGGGGEGLDAGATKEQYRDAFADLDTIKLTFQSSGTPKSTASAMFESYQATLEDWSGGTFEIEHVYSDGVAPLLEADNAMADGRLDVAAIAAANEPQEYPVSAMLNSMSFQGSQNPLVNAMVTQAWGNEIALASDELRDEYEQMGVVPLVPFYTGGTVGLFCTDAVKDSASLKGRQVGTSTSAQMEQVKKLGMTPVSLPFTEAFESLQRGVIDCSVQSFRVAGMIKLTDVAPHVIVDPEAGWGLSMGAFSVSQRAYDSMPLVAQQLMHDRSVDFLVDQMKGVLESASQQVASMNAAGITVQALDDAGRATLQKANASILDGLVEKGAAGDATADMVKRSGELVTEWEALVADLGYPTDVDLNEFAEYWKDADLDWEPLRAALVERVFDPNRPA